MNSSSSIYQTDHKKSSIWKNILVFILLVSGVSLAIYFTKEDEKSGNKNIKRKNKYKEKDKRKRQIQMK